MVLALLGAGAYAQAPTPPAATNTAPPPTAPAETVDASKVPDNDKLKQSSESLTLMRAALKDVLAKLEEARNTKDVVKLNCVNEKLTQIKGLLRISEQSDVQLQEAVAKKEAAIAEHEYMKTTIARNKVVQLRAEAEECIGQLAFRTDENMQIDIETPDYLPPGDPAQVTPPTPINSRPPPASPVL